MKLTVVLILSAILVGGLALLIYTPPPQRFTTIEQSRDAKADGSRTPVPSHELVFCSDPWLPYVGTAGDEHEGYIIDLLREVYRPQGYTVRLVNKPWTRCIEEVRAGLMDGLSQADINEAPDFVFSKETIGTTRPTFFVRSGSTWTFSGTDSLSSIRLGAIQSYSYEPAIDAYITKESAGNRLYITHGNDALDRLIAALQAGQIDAFIENRLVGLYTMRKLKVPGESITTAGEAAGVKLFLPLSPKREQSSALAQLFDARVRELRTSGQLDAILRKNDTEDWSTVGESKK